MVAWSTGDIWYTEGRSSGWWFGREYIWDNHPFVVIQWDLWWFNGTLYTNGIWMNGMPSGKHTKSDGTSPCHELENQLFLWPFSIAM